MKTYILIPSWCYEDFSSKNEAEWKQWWDIPTYFVNVFTSKKAIEEYLNKYNYAKDVHGCDKTLNSKLHSTMIARVFEKFKNDHNDEKALRTSFNYKRVEWFVITCDEDPSKENRLGIMQRCRNKDGEYKWKYVSMFGGKVWRDDLLFRGSY